MKKILIVTPTLQNGGGVIRSLQNFMANIPKNRYSVDILPTGYSSKDVVRLQNCRILPTDFLLSVLTSVYKYTEGYKFRTLLYLSKLCLRLLSYIGLRGKLENLIYKNRSQKYLNYDLVIAFQEGPTTSFVSNIIGPKKVAWIHCDYKERFKTLTYDEINIYKSFDLINSVSNYTKLNFDSIYPSLSFKSDYIYNFLDTSFILDKSNESISDLVLDDSKMLFISIGRISVVKQFSLIPSIIHKLLKKRIFSFKWILMGVPENVEEMEMIKREVEKYNITKEHFEYIGKRMNPYPYIKRSDFLISLSKSEACPFVVNEARVLNVPVISNNYPSIYEFIQNGINGYICPIEDMADLLEKLVTNKDMMQRLQENILKVPYSNKEIIKKFLKVLDM